jgi:hypothetical protein
MEQNPAWEHNSSSASQEILRIIQINHQPDATIFQFIILTFIYSSTCFGHFPAHHQELNDCSGSLYRIVVIVVLCSWSGRPAGRPDHDQHHYYHHTPKVKPEAATAVVVAPDDGREGARIMLSCK